MSKGYVYILKCNDGSYYTGSTIDLERRMNEHQNGQGANHTKKRLPIKLVFSQEFPRIEEAYIREKQIQGWSKKKKETLIKNNFEQLPDLSIAYRDKKDLKKVYSRTSDTNLSPSNTLRNELRSEILGVPEVLEGNIQLRSDISAIKSLPSSVSGSEQTYYSNGKLLLTGEYFVLEGAKSLAVPTTCGQDLIVQSIDEPQLIWQSYSNTGECWLEAIFDLPKLRIVSADFSSEINGGDDTLDENLRKILLEVRHLKPDFLNSKKGILVKTNLTFPKNWGLGTSSTLINNLANWTEIDPYILLSATFGGSGYDIACAKYNTPILYTKGSKVPLVEKVEFEPSFIDQLFFVYLNKKQNSREGIQRFKNLKGSIALESQQISSLTDAFLRCDNLDEFERLLFEHEQIVSKTIQLKTVQEQYFSDYFGQTKSLGAWGGDFILATGNDDSRNYFNKKGFQTVIPYQDLIL